MTTYQSLTLPSWAGLKIALDYLPSTQMAHQMGHESVSTVSG